MRAAFHVARSGRCGPVLVDVPRDLQEATLDFAYPDDVDLPGWRPPTKVHPLQIREAARAIAHARKPVLYVGGGTLNGDACAELARLAEAGTLPVITTLMGKSAFPETHELHFGWPGMHGTKWSNLAMNTCDVLVAIGARFDDRVTGKLSAFAPGATVVHLDIDPAEISKLRDADIPVVGPLQTAVGELADEVAAQRAEGAPAPEAWLAQIRAWREEFPLRYDTSEEWLKPQQVVETLQRAHRRRRTRSSPRASASTRCGRCSTSSPSGRAASSPRAGSGRWATGSPPRSAPRRRAPRRPSSASTATAASR